MTKPIIIAEACCNHMGNIDIAKQLILAAKNNGADYIKFQKRDINAWIQRKPNIYNYPHPNAEILLVIHMQNIENFWNLI